MYTLLIIAVVTSGVCLILWLCGNLGPKACDIASISVAVLLALACCSTLISERNIQEGYTKIESYSYVTKTGSTETIDGPFYKKNDVYYKQDLTKANWIPFAPYDYVEVDLPKSVEPHENSTGNFCPNCKTEQSTAFCPDCGAPSVETIPMCPNCNTECNTKYCPDCGEKIN